MKQMQTGQSETRRRYWMLGGALALVVVICVAIAIVLTNNKGSSNNSNPNDPAVGCNLNCGDHGSCVFGEDGTTKECECTDGYDGAKCTIAPAAENVCSVSFGGCDETRGTCKPSAADATVAICGCKTGYKLGSDKKTCTVNPTNTTCSLKCGSHGECTVSGGAEECTCSGGYTGDLCDKPPATSCDPACGTHGTCTAGSCVCKDGYTGDSCETAPAVTCNPACGTHGTCTAGKCVCKDGYTGATCATAPTPTCTPACGTHGTCTAKGETASCVCKDNYTGAACDNPPVTPPPPQGNGLDCDKEFCGADCKVTVPDLGKYTNAKFPNPFVFFDGTKMTKLSEWQCRRAEVKAAAEKFEYGVKDAKPPGTVTGSMNGNTLVVSVGGKSFNAKITYPTKGTAPYPAIIAVDGGSLPTSMTTGFGIALINLPTTDIASQASAGARGTGLFWQFSGSTDAGSLIGWAWGASRIIDALEVTPAAKIDPKRLGVTGCSRNGKGALAMGAFDQRVALVIAHEGGAGGDACWRSSAADSKAQPLSSASSESTWFKANFGSNCANKINNLPYDHHQILGMVAPRGLFIIENQGWDWLGETSCIAGSSAARLLYEALGIKDRIGFINTNHQHCGEWLAGHTTAMTPFLNRFLMNQTADTSNKWTVVGGSYKQADWVDWASPLPTFT